MKKILRHLERGPSLFASDHPEMDDSLHIVFAARNKVIGLAWRDSIILLLFGTFTSARVASFLNLGQLGADLRIAKALYDTDTAYLADYFRNNSDNPYAIWHVFHQIPRGDPLTTLTQYPPLEPARSADERTSRLERLLRLAQPGDLLFSYDCTSRVSGLIRKYDRNPWSHVATLTTRLTTVDSGPGGISENSIDDYRYTPHDIALYRYRGIEPAKAIAVARAVESQVGPAPYNWYAIVRLYLRSRFRVPYSGGPTIGDIIYSNRLDLVAYV